MNTSTSQPFLMQAIKYEELRVTWKYSPDLKQTHWNTSSHQHSNKYPKHHRKKVNLSPRSCSVYFRSADGLKHIHSGLIWPLRWRSSENTAAGENTNSIAKASVTIEETQMLWPSITSHSKNPFCTWLEYTTRRLKAVISSTGVFVAIDNNTLHGSKL